eukprot:Nk52_evm76s1073 gene=Nk52_evmTU76s1073
MLWSRSASLFLQGTSRSAVQAGGASSVARCMWMGWKRDLHVEKRLEEMGIVLHDSPAKPQANYVPIRQSGNLYFLSGHLPFDAKKDNKLKRGKLGSEFTVKDGYAQAELVAVNLLATLKSEIGSLDKVTKICKVNGFVNCTAEFDEQHLVLDGCSNLLVKAFGEEVGRHARAAAGFVSLPLSAPVEIEMIVEVQ